MSRLILFALLTFAACNSDDGGTTTPDLAAIDDLAQSALDLAPDLALSCPASAPAPTCAGGPPCDPGCVCNPHTTVILFDGGGGIEGPVGHTCVCDETSWNWISKRCCGGMLCGELRGQFVTCTAQRDCTLER